MSKLENPNPIDIAKATLDELCAKPSFRGRLMELHRSGHIVYVQAEHVVAVDHARLHHIFDACATPAKERAAFFAPHDPALLRVIYSHGEAFVFRLEPVLLSN